MTAVVMIMDDMSTVEALEALSEAISPYIVPILKQELGETAPQHKGTGFLVQAENHCFLISAAHVLDKPSDLFFYLDGPPRYCRLRQRPTLFTNPPPGKTRREDRVDVGVCYLGPLSSLPGIERVAVPVGLLKPAALPREDKWYFLAGLPGGSRQINVNRRAKLIASNRATTIAPSHAAKVYHSCGVTPESHIVIDHTRDLRPGLSNRRGKFPKTAGMSGSPLWLLKEKGEEDSIMRLMVIVGVFIEYDGPRRALISTDIGEAHKMLHALLAITGHWEITNRRRTYLLAKKVEQHISIEESRELRALQVLADLRSRLQAPPPFGTKK